MQFIIFIFTNRNLELRILKYKYIHKGFKIYEYEIQNHID